MKAVYRFDFGGGTERRTIETAIASAVLNAESCLGKARVRLWGGYDVSDNSPHSALLMRAPKQAST